MELKLLSGWQKKELQELVDIRYGKGLKKDQRIDGNYGVYGSNGVVGSHKEYYVSHPTIIIGRKGSVGEITYIDSPSWPIDTTFFLVPKQESLFEMKYLFYYLKKENLKRFSISTGVPGINVKSLNKVEVILPPIELQRKIIKYFELLDNLKQRRQKVNEDTKIIIQSIFAEMFGDPTKNNKKYPIEVLDNVAEKITDGTHITPKYVEEGVPFLRVTDITNSNDSKKYITKDEHQELTKRCKPEKGDILYTKNGTIGIAKTIDWDYKFSIFVSLCLIKPKKDKILPKYLEVFLNTPFALSQALQHSKKGTITNLHLIEIKKIKVPIPPISKQKEFLDIVERIERIMKHQNSSTLEINDLSDSLMQQAFVGQLIK